jgi:hypothetical protein
MRRRKGEICNAPKEEYEKAKATIKGMEVNRANLVILVERLYDRHEYTNIKQYIRNILRSRFEFQVTKNTIEEWTKPRKRKVGRPKKPGPKRGKRRVKVNVREYNIEDPPMPSELDDIDASDLVIDDKEMESLLNEQF